MCVCGRSCVACTMYTTELLTSVQRGAARARTQMVAQLAPRGGTTKRRSMCPGLKWRASKVATGGAPGRLRSACGMSTVTGSTKSGPTPRAAASTPATSA